MSSTGTRDLPRASRELLPDQQAQVYVVVATMAGTAVDAFSFRRSSDARRCLKRLRRESDPNDDDVQLFLTSLDSDSDAELLKVDLT